MALPASGAISFSNINTEMGVSATAQRSLNDSTTRTLFGVASGSISMSTGYGKSNQISLTIASNQANLDLRTWAVNNGWNQSARVIVTINSGIIVYSTSTGGYALSISGSWPGGIQLINNGYIVGCGGAGGNGPSYAQCQAGGAGNPGGAGGTALYAGLACTITNNGIIGGGGGGGGSMGGPQLAGSWYYTYGGAGGGGGAGYGAAGTKSPYSVAGVQNGTAGSLTGGGAGGAGTAYGSAGSGGGLGAVGGNGAAQVVNKLPGGGGGGAGGYCTVGNAYITWAAAGTRYGSLG